MVILSSRLFCYVLLSGPKTYPGIVAIAMLGPWKQEYQLKYTSQNLVRTVNRRFISIIPMILHRGNRLNFFLPFGLKYPLPIRLALRHLLHIPQPNTQPIHTPLQFLHIRILDLTPIQNLPRPPHFHPPDELQPQHLRLPDPFSQYHIIRTPPPLHPALQRLLHINPNHNRTPMPHPRNDPVHRPLLRLTSRLKIPVELGHLLQQPSREVDMRPPHRLQPATLGNFLPGPFGRSMHDKIQTVGVG